MKQNSLVSYGCPFNPYFVLFFFVISTIKQSITSVGKLVHLRLVLKIKKDVMFSMSQVLDKELKP